MRKAIILFAMTAGFLSAPVYAEQVSFSAPGNAPAGMESLNDYPTTADAVTGVVGDARKRAEVDAYSKIMLQASKWNDQNYYDGVNKAVLPSGSAFPDSSFLDEYAPPTVGTIKSWKIGTFSYAPGAWLPTVMRWKASITRYTGYFRGTYTVYTREELGLAPIPKKIDPRPVPPALPEDSAPVLPQPPYWPTPQF